VHKPNARVDTTTGRHTITTLSSQGKRRPEEACVTHDNCCPFSHRTMFSGTPSRICVASPPSTPLTRRRPNFSLYQAATRRCHPTSPFKTPRRVPRVARRGTSNILSGLWPRPTMTMATMRKLTTPTWGLS
jgi:hypothetical protein